ncbi:MAG: EamA family transporter [Candidatus Woesearchaeota archaeon]
MAQLWIFYALLSAIFAALVAIFGKIGLDKVDTNLATTIRALVMFLFLLLVISFQKKYLLLKQVEGMDYLFIILAGIAGAISWLFYFLALKSGEASRVASLDRLSVVFILIFALLFLGEKFSLLKASGVALIVVGSLLMVI